MITQSSDHNLLARRPYYRGDNAERNGEYVHLSSGLYADIGCHEVLCMRWIVIRQRVVTPNKSLHHEIIQDSKLISPSGGLEVLRFTTEACICH